MRKKRHIILPVIAGFTVLTSNAQSTESNYVLAIPAADRTIEFNSTDEGKSTPIIWGLDLAWLSEGNVRRGLAFMGNENVNIIRSEERRVGKGWRL